MTDISYRPDRLQRVALAALKARFNAQLDAINESLADEGVSWSISPFDVEAIRQRSLVERLPGDEPSKGHELRLVAGAALHRPKSVGRIGVQSPQLAVAIYLGVERLQGDVEADDGAIIQAGWACLDAAWWALAEGLSTEPYLSELGKPTTEVQMNDWSEGPDDTILVTQVVAILRVTPVIRRVWRRP